MIMTKIYGHFNLPYLSYDLLFTQQLPNGETAFGQPVDIVLKPGKQNVLAAPTLRLEDAAARDLFQQMWDQGFRPVNGSGGKAEVDALQKHIAFAERVALTFMMPTISPLTK